MNYFHQHFSETHPGRLQASKTDKFAIIAHWSKLLTVVAKDSILFDFGDSGYATPTLLHASSDGKLICSNRQLRQKSVL